MNYQIICGNLGADAEFKNEQGHEFVKFNVADTRKWTGSDNVEHEETTWVSCIINGKAENLMPYLKKGVKVLVMGQSSVRVYSSEKFRRMVAGINLRVDRLELVGGQSELVPRRLVTSEGEIVETFKAYFVKQDVAQKQGATIDKNVIILDERNNTYVLAATGQVWPMQQQSVSDEHTDEQVNQ